MYVSYLYTLYTYIPYVLLLSHLSVKLSYDLAIPFRYDLSVSFSLGIPFRLCH